MSDACGIGGDDSYLLSLSMGSVGTNIDVALSSLSRTVFMTTSVTHSPMFLSLKHRLLFGYGRFPEVSSDVDRLGLSLLYEAFRHGFPSTGRPLLSQVRYGITVVVPCLQGVLSRGCFITGVTDWLA